MSKSDEYREMQISSGQLAAVILSLLALCVLIFYLGIRVGMNKAAETPTLKAQTQAVAPLKAAPVETKPALVEPKPSGETIPPAAAETKAPPKVEAKSAAEKTPPQTAVESKPKQTAAAKTSPTPAGTYYIQVGALDTRPTAETFAQRIEGLGYRAIVLNPFAGDKKTVYRVRVGPYETKEAAETARTKLASVLNRKIADFFIVKG
ncbi:MAG: SPOR domain-containing protein [Candidatus Aminicenantes bacterium]|nr:SPOR domain-containing protein [Candidatus Aminicenantes bacterium]